MITNNWTAFIEYNYYEFDKKNYGFPILPALLAPATLTINADVRNTLSVAKVGVNYKFDFGGAGRRPVLIFKSLNPVRRRIPRAPNPWDFSRVVC